MNKTTGQIFSEARAEDALIKLIGSENIPIDHIAPFEQGKKGAMVFAPNQTALKKAKEQGTSLIIIPQNLQYIAVPALAHNAIITSKNIGLSHAKLKQRYAAHDYAQTGWERIHPSAHIHESVHLPEGIRIGPNVVIEKGVKIGAASHIMANVVLQHGAIIGNNCQIHPGVIIGWGCMIGNDCQILANSVIGGEGFGFAQDQYFNHHAIPQTGKVIIGDRVVIGALNTIDRATYGATKIGNGCIFDNICHVAHNVEIGENCIILSGFLCAGSSILGNRVVASGGTMIKDHVKICDNTYLVHRAGVIKDITTPGMYAGSPIQPMKKYVQNKAIYEELTELRKIVKALREEMDHLKK
jgi:UDP-3-O-[3-hydroxymyristoyl] glucosamine N-acyltransferase